MSVAPIDAPSTGRCLRRPAAGMAGLAAALVLAATIAPAGSAHAAEDPPPPPVSSPAEDPLPTGTSESRASDRITPATVFV